MSTSVTFEIAPSYIPTFIKHREIKGGCVVPVRRQDTGEFGALLLCHTPSVSKWESQMDKIKWIVSCNCPYDDKSPFGGNSHASVRTIYRGGLLECGLINRIPLGYDDEGEDYLVNEEVWLFNLTENHLNNLEQSRIMSYWIQEYSTNEFQVYWDYVDYYLNYNGSCYKLADCYGLSEVRHFIETRELFEI